MNATMCMNGKRSRSHSPRPFDSEVVELTILLPGWQAASLETVAHERGLTVGQYLRRLIQESTVRAKS